jgi:hypothetical protein
VNCCAGLAIRIADKRDVLAQQVDHRVHVAGSHCHQQAADHLVVRGVDGPLVISDDPARP